MFPPLNRLIHYSEPVIRRIEDHLEASGKWEQAQRLRLLQCRVGRIFLHALKRMVSFIETEIYLQEIIQRETFLHKSCQELHEKLSSKNGTLTHSEEIQSEKWSNELEDLKKQYWRQEREKDSHNLWHIRGSMTRAYFSNQKNPKQHLHRELRLHCAGQGGCCGRGCGCCERPRSTTREESFGHCTYACECCQQYRGFEIQRGSEDYECSQQTTQFLRDRLSAKNKLLRACVFGI